MARGKDIHWIAADWGTTNLRCWAMGDNGTIHAKAESGDGMANIVSEQDCDFERALLRLVNPWLVDGKTMQVRACGMVGAKAGWVEVPYSAVPCPPSTPTTMVSPKSPALEVHIHAGVKQGEPADVMRGEETQLAGLIAKDPGFEGLVCLPGTHSKWVGISGGNVIYFQTFLTGELFSLLSKKSVLSQTLTGDGDELDRVAFREGFLASLDNPQSWLPSLFSLRAEALLAGLAPPAARSRLSGILLGCEFGAMQGKFGLGEVALAASDTLAGSYCLAFETLGVKAIRHNPEELVLAGLCPDRI